MNFDGAGDESRTRDLNLGKVALYQLSYSRVLGTHQPDADVGDLKFLCGAGDESRTRDLNLGKVALYQLSYSRTQELRIIRQKAVGGAKRNRTAVNGFAIRCITTLLSRPRAQLFLLIENEFRWSGRRVSNSRPQPWQGCALPTELLPRRRGCESYSISQACQAMKTTFLSPTSPSL